MLRNRKQSSGEIYLFYNMTCMQCILNWQIVCRRSVKAISHSLCRSRLDLLTNCCWHIEQFQWSLNAVSHSSQTISSLFFDMPTLEGYFGGLRQVRFSFCKNLLKAREPYCKTGLIHDRKISRISRFSRKSRNFLAREIFLFYSILTP